MTSYKVGYFVGSLSSTSINRTLVQSAHPAGARRSRVQRDTDQQPAAVQPRTTTSNYPPEAIALKEAIGRVRRHLVRHPGVQPLDPGGA